MEASKETSPPNSLNSSPEGVKEKAVVTYSVNPVVTNLNHKIGFIGGGQMALALAKGFMQSGLIRPYQIVTSAPSDTNLIHWRQLGAVTTNINSVVITNCDVIFLAVKPNIFSKVIADLQEVVSLSGIKMLENANESSTTNASVSKDGYLSVKSKLFVSIMAGITIENLTSALSNITFDPRVIRAIPNTPAMIGYGCSVYSLGKSATESDGYLVKQLFESVGICEEVPEYQQDAFTGMVGSGPAYIYTIIEAFSDGGVMMGLPRNLASKFAAQMTMGSAKMAMVTGKHTGELKDDVTSPGGTTIQGIHALERGGIRGTIMDAIKVSSERAKELGKMF